MSVFVIKQLNIAVKKERCAKKERINIRKNRRREKERYANMVRKIRKSTCKGEENKVYC